MIRCLRLILSAALVTSVAWGADSKSGLFKFEFRSDILAGAFSQQNQDSVGNQGNLVLYFPSQSMDLEIKPYIKIESNKFNFSLFMNPRLRAQSVQYQIATGTLKPNPVDYGFWEAYLAWELVKNVDVKVGIVNAQWGPSDLLSPSQFMFPDLLLKPEPFFSTQGLELASIQYTPNQKVSLTFMAELPPFGWEKRESLPAVDRTTQHRVLMRGEYAAESGEYAMGIVFGQRETDKKRFQLGNYSFWSYSQEAQVYYDFVAQQGSGRPYVNDSGVVELTFADDSDINAVGLIGHRYSFANGLEWKVEFVGNSFGLSKADRENTFDWLHSDPFNVGYLQVLHSSLSPLPGRYFLFNSFRWDNLLDKLFSNSYVFFRDIYSITDGSQLMSLGAETSLTDSLSQSLAMVYTIGNNEQELSSFLKSYISYYLKYSF